MRAKGILFDLDGTLIDSGLDLAIGVNYALHALSIEERPVELIRSFVGDGVTRLLERSLGPDHIHRIEECRAIFVPHYREHCLDNTHLYPGAFETIAELKKSYPLGLITNKDREFSKSILEGLGILPFFDDIVGGDTLANLKPHPDGLFYFARMFGVETGDLVMVGDHVTDLEMCRRGGALSIFCRFGMGSMGDYTPDAIIDSLPELLPLLAAP
jgi:phosphoglycolate phosphatase